MLSFKQFITEDADTDTKLKKLGLKRTTKFGKIGKEIGGEIYLHRQYENTFPEDLLNTAKQSLPENFDYQVVKYNPKTGVFSFIVSNDFDTNEEPSVNGGITVKPDGTAKPFKDAGWIYHHKWEWVADDYKGFDVQKSKERSLKWSSLDGIDKARIGQRKHWDDNVVNRITESTTNSITWVKPILKDEFGEYFENSYTKKMFAKLGYKFKTHADLLTFLDKGKLTTITKEELESNYNNLTLDDKEFKDEIADAEYAQSYNDMKRDMEKGVTLPAPIIIKFGDMYYGYAGNRRTNLAFRNNLPLKVWLVKV